MDSSWLLFIAGIIVTLQGWMLTALIDMKTALATIKAQVSRFASDIESEKRSRAEAHKDLSDKIQHLEGRLGGC
jgi:hypothetical protein